MSPGLYIYLMRNPYQVATRRERYEATIFSLDLITLILLVVVCIAVIGHVARSCP